MKRNSLAFTLLELLVSFFIFAMLGTLIALSLRSYAASQVKTNTGTDVDRALSTTAGRIETLLRGCRVLAPSPGDESDTLSFQAPLISPEGLLVVGPTGEPLWQPAREITLQNGLLVVTGDTQTVVGNLGPAGSITYQRPDPGILRVLLTATFEGAESVARKSDTLTVDLATVP